MIDMFLSNEGGFDGIQGQSLQAFQCSGVRFLLCHALDEIDNECGRHDVPEQALWALITISKEQCEESEADIIDDGEFNRVLMCSADIHGCGMLGIPDTCGIERSSSHWLLRQQ